MLVGALSTKRCADVAVFHIGSANLGNRAADNGVKANCLLDRFRSVATTFCRRWTARAPSPSAASPAAWGTGGSWGRSTPTSRNTCWRSPTRRTFSNSRDSRCEQALSTRPSPRRFSPRSFYNRAGPRIALSTLLLMRGIRLPLSVPFCMPRKEE